MTFQIAGHWLAVPVAQMDRIAFAERVWPVPLGRPEHLGLIHDADEIIPVLRLQQSNEKSSVPPAPQLVAVLHVRGESVGLAVDSAGHVYDHYQLEEDQPDPPESLSSIFPKRVKGADRKFWLIDPDF